MNSVILRGVDESRSESSTQSKDPYPQKRSLYPYAFPGFRRENDRL